jgi:hypothetical protein
MSEAAVAAAPPASEPAADTSSAMQVDSAPPAGASLDAQHARATSPAASAAHGKATPPPSTTSAVQDPPANEAPAHQAEDALAQNAAPAAQTEEPSTSAAMGPPAPAAAAESASAAVPASTTGGARVYLATYSSVPVYELTVRGIAVMRRRADGFLNATQILKVAGIEKGRRTKILEKEILTGEHEKVQGGYGKYQGTW